MTFAQVLSAYAALNVAVAFACIGLVAIEKLLPRLKAGVHLEIHYCVAAMILGVVVLHSTLPRSQFFEPVAKVWAASSMTALSTSTAEPDISAYVSFHSDQAHDAGSLGLLLAALAVLVLAIWLAHLIRSVRQLRALLRRSYLLRRVGSVRIWTSEEVRVPFSHWVPGRTHVVIPLWLVDSPDIYRMVIAHELQHHRQGDTLWLYFFGLLQFICAINPFVHVWARRVSNTQELACDEAVLDHHRWSAKRYGTCLIEVAERAAGGRAIYAGAIALLGSTDRNILKRRMQNMLRLNKATRGRGFVLGVASLFFIVMSTTSHAAGGWVQDRRVTLDQAQALAERWDASNGFSITVNDEVLQELNRYAGTPQGREFMRGSLKRFDAYRSLVSATFTRYQVPAALMAVPVVESGYENLDQSHNRYQGAGLWQFIPQTARAFGLRVDEQADERLDPALLTDAAARLLQADRLQFQDWQLALLAYNMGDKQVQQAIQSTGSRDAWTLVRSGHEGDKGYLARVHAAALIMANPSMVE